MATLWTSSVDPGLMAAITGGIVLSISIGLLLRMKRGAR